MCCRCDHILQPVSERRAGDPRAEFVASAGRFAALQSPRLQAASLHLAGLRLQHRGECSQHLLVSVGGVTSSGSGAHLRAAASALR